MPFASNRPWAAALLFALLAALMGGWLLLYWMNKADVDTKLWRQVQLPLLLLLGVQLWVLLQILPLPRTLVELLSPQAADWHIAETWISLSLDPEHTRLYLLNGVAISLGFVLTVLLVNSHERVRILLKTLVFSGTMQALYGTYMVLSGQELGFFVEKYVGVGAATGTFVNSNHFAGYLVLCLSAGIGLLLSQLEANKGGSWRAHFKRWLLLLLSPRMRLRFYLAIMVIALVLTHSRSGNFAFFASLIAAGGLALVSGRHFSPRLLVFLASLIVVDLVLVGQWFGIEEVANRLQQTELKSEPRTWSNRNTVDMIADFPLTGSGGGSFYGIFPNYQSQELQGLHTHAHNDYLEFAAELGLPATAVLMSFVGLALLSAWRLQSQRHTPLYKGVGFTSTMAVAWAVIHSATDFNLQIPANALTFITLLSLAHICRNLPSFTK